jgi:hypothetical protein
VNLSTKDTEENPSKIKKCQVDEEGTKASWLVCCFVFSVSLAVNSLL